MMIFKMKKVNGYFLKVLIVLTLLFTTVFIFNNGLSATEVIIDKLIFLF
ncbi:hypothetical protein [Methanobrevibacter arboriphilus]|nr:hypothetical protein [Methanobrevibacter arboriphilus]